MGVDPSEVAVQRRLGVAGGGPGDGERGAEDRVGAEAGLVRRGVEIDEGEVDSPLVIRLDAPEGVGDLAGHVRDGLAHPLAAVAFVAVPSSTASKRPVDAPDGTIALPLTPESRRHVTSMVGLPRESRTSRAERLRDPAHWTCVSCERCDRS